MINKEKLFVVVDPSQDEPFALNRAIINAGIRKENERPDLYIFIAVDGEAVDTRANNDSLFRNREWFLKLTDPIEQAGVDFTVELSFSTEWQKSILREAQRFSADMIMVPVHRNPSASRLTFSDAKWELLRNAECPILLCHGDTAEKRDTILAAVRVQSDSYTDLNQKIITRAKWAADRYGASLHMVNAYRDSMDYPDRSKLLKLAELPSKNIHIRQGAPEDVISAVANEIGAASVVMGTKRRHGLIGSLRGNTAERVIEKLSQDIMTIN